MEILLWVSAAAVVYVYAGYPLLLAALAALFRRPIRKKPIEPYVSMLVAAYNEADVIADKIRNALTLDYPADKIEIAIASDGSKDGTAAIAREFATGPHVSVFDYPANRGKITVLNETLPHLCGEIVALTDASSMLAPDALRRLVANFADPEVGAVSGVYKVRRKEEAQLGVQEDFYWKYETFLKVQEAALGSILGCHGSLYAVRKELYPFPAPGTINDDYVIPVRILQRGYRVAYEPGAVAYEEAHEMGGFSRRVRIMAGNVQQLREIKPLLRPLRPKMLFFFLSHKAGRVAAPLFLLLLIALNALLLGHSALYLWLGILQAAFYLIAAAGAVWKLRPRMLLLPYYFTMINAAAFLAMYYVFFGRRALAWKR
jgi:biofilm PGA synthesis N-glycosyltransferase PgaC